MTISQLLEQEKNNYNSFEIYRYCDYTHMIHICYLDSLTEEIPEDIYSNLNVIDYKIFNQEEYNKAFFAKAENEKDCFPCLIIIIDYDTQEDYNDYDDFDDDF